MGDKKFEELLHLDKKVETLTITEPYELGYFILL